MIKLKNPLNYKGLLYEAGTVLSVPPELEDKLVKTGSAERYVAPETDQRSEAQTGSQTKIELQPGPEPELAPLKKGGK